MNSSDTMASFEMTLKNGCFTPVLNDLEEYWFETGMLFTLLVGDRSDETPQKYGGGDKWDVNSLQRLCEETLNAERNAGEEYSKDFIEEYDRFLAQGLTVNWTKMFWLVQKYILGE